MPNPPSDPYGHQAQAAAIAAAQAQRAAAQQIQNAGYAAQLDAQRRGQQQVPWPPDSPGVPKGLKLAVLYVVICLFIIFVLMIVGFFGAFG